jgi:DNA-binding protein YbaB
MTGFDASHEADRGDAIDARIDALANPPTPDPASIQAFSERTFRFETPDGFANATVNGGSELIELELMVTATRGEARETLGEHVVAAVNGALAMCAAARRAEFGLTGPAEALAAKADAFAERMNAVAGEMNTLRGSLTTRLAEIQELYKPR